MVALVVAIVGVALSMTKWRSEARRKWTVALCWVVAAELLVGLIVSRNVFLFVTLPLGVLILVAFAVWLKRHTPAPNDLQRVADSAAFETLQGGRTIVEGGSVTGYERVSRVASGVAHFVDVKIRKR